MNAKNLVLGVIVAGALSTVGNAWALEQTARTKTRSTTHYGMSNRPDVRITARQTASGIHVKATEKGGRVLGVAEIMTGSKASQAGATSQASKGAGSSISFKASGSSLDVLQAILKAGQSEMIKTLPVQPVARAD